MITPAEEVKWFRIDDRAGDGQVRRAAAALAGRLGFSEARTGEVAIVATELTTNVARHAGGGAIALRRLSATSGVLAGVGLLAVDSGPGMDDAAARAVDGESTAGSLGIGLGAVHRLATSAHSYSVPARGTVIDVAMRPAGCQVEADDAAALARPMTNEEVCGDAYLVVSDGPRRVLVLADGLGHGPLAARASQAAMQVAIDQPEAGPADMIAEMHRRIGHSRGAAVAVAELDLDKATLGFAGVGNVSAWIVQHDGRRGMPSQPGIVGAGIIKKVRHNTYPLDRGAVVVLHSDGLTGRWDLASYPGLRARPPIVTAAVLMRDAGTRHDDASVVVSTMTT